MAALDWPDLQAELTACLPDLAEELLGPPTFRSQREWRWGRHGSLAVVIAGAKAGCWFDHEAGVGGRMVDLIARQRGTDRTAALTWSAVRIGQRPGMRPPVSGRMPAATIDRSAKARQRAADIWTTATPAPADHLYLLRKRVRPHDLRCDASGNLIIPLRDAEGVLRTVETITPEGDKRYLAGGAKAGHFCAIGGAPEPAGVVIICEGWATGASLHEATGQPVAAAMDAGNLGPVARSLRRHYADASIIIVADNDDRPGRDTNPGVSAATKAASAIDARLAIPPVPGDANDLACLLGADAVAAMVAAAASLPSSAPTYAEPQLSPQAARETLAQAIRAFMAEVPAYWRAFEADAKAATPNDPLDFNVPTLVLPPLLGLQVDVGLGKTRAARQEIADLLAAGGLGRRKVVFAVPRHDLGTEQVRAFAALGVAAMLWKGRTAPDPSCDNPDRLMCLDPEATFDALEVEQAVEQSCCKVKRGGVLRLCPQFHACGYQRQKPVAHAAQVIVCAHDSLFHIKPEVVGKVGLLVIDEAFWQAGLRGLDGKAVLTQDGLEPGRASISCFRPNGRFDVNATAELTAARHKLWKALTATEPGPLKHGLLVSVGLTAEECRDAAILERRRLRDPGLLPGMAADERRRRIEKVLPPFGAPWAPSGRCAALWSILATALEHGHDAGGAVLVNEMSANGSIRALRLRWRDPLRVGWAADIPVLHLDATLREALVRPYLPRLVLHAPVAARLPHVRFRQVLDSPTTAKALTPSAQGAQRDRLAARHHLRDLQAYIALRARECQMGRDTRLLVVGQKAAIDALRSAGLPTGVEVVHFNGLSGLDRWGDVGCLIVLGRTLPAPATVETLAAALSGRIPEPGPSDAGWWYGTVEKRIRLEGGRTYLLPGEMHPDATAEAIRWSICEAELIQAIGRGRGVNRTTDTVLAVDLLTDVVLPVTVHELMHWVEVRPSRRDLMAVQGVVLENAADMSACFPELWPTHEAARKDAQRTGTNCYYRIFYNSKMSHSSAAVTYQPAGAGKRPRRATFDLLIVPDPGAWLTARLGPLAACVVQRQSSTCNIPVPHPLIRSKNP